MLDDGLDPSQQKRLAKIAAAAQQANTFAAIADELLVQKRREGKATTPSRLNLAHVEGNSVRRAYARAEFWDERIRMMAWWANQLDTFRSR